MSHFGMVRIQGLHEKTDGWYLGVGKDGKLVVVTAKGGVWEVPPSSVEFVIAEPCPQTPPIAMGAIHADRVTTAEAKKTEPAWVEKCAVALFDAFAEEYGPDRAQYWARQQPHVRERYRMGAVAVVKWYLAQPLWDHEVEAACNAYLSALERNGPENPSVNKAAMRHALNKFLEVVQIEAASL